MLEDDTLPKGINQTHLEASEPQLSEPDIPEEEDEDEGLAEPIVWADPADATDDDGPVADADGLYVHQTIIADKKQGAIRLDKFIQDRIANTTRNKVQTAIDNGYILVNGLTAKASYKIKPADEVTFRLPAPPRDNVVLPEDIPLEIVYEDADVLLVDKAAGMVVHPAHGNWSGTLVNGLVHHLRNLPTHRNGDIRPGLVHRIDKDTSGLLVIAKNEFAMAFLADQFFKHTTKRRYLALVWGTPKEDEGTIDVNLARSPKDRRLVVAVPDGQTGRRAITHYKVLERLHYVSLIECRLETGRTHQIRAHMKYLGHPLFSDSMYGGDKILKGTTFTKYRQFVENCFRMMPRQALHAQILGFVHPVTRQELYFESPLPEDFVAVLDKWRKYANTEETKDSWV